jgi:hypothetical protein
MPTGTYGGVRGRGHKAPAYSILSWDDPGNGLEEYCFGDLCVDHIVSRGSGRKRLALESGPRSMLAVRNRAEREGTRLDRFLDSIRSTPEILIPLHVALACGNRLGERLLRILDQTTIWGIETLLSGLVFEGRVLPIAFSCFMKEFIHKSQNILEHTLILAAMSCFPVEFRPLLILDRGYARVALLIHLRGEGIPFLCRAKRSVMVYLPGQTKGQTVGRFKIKDSSFITRCSTTPRKRTPSI